MTEHVRDVTTDHGHTFPITRTPKGNGRWRYEASIGDCDACEAIAGDALNKVATKARWLAAFNAATDTGERP